MVLERIKEYIDFKKITISAFEKSIGMSNASFGKSLKNGGAIGTDKLENILIVYADINPIWLLTGEGSMLRSDGATDTHNIPITDTSSDSNMHSDAVTLRLMDKLDEKDNIIKEKEAKIEQLQTELREKSEELAALKAFHQHIHIRGYHDQPDIEGTRKGLGQ